MKIRVLLICFFAIIISSCTHDPEELILGEWVEIKWEYEDYEKAESKKHDKVQILKHETEKWIFNSNHSFKIKKADGTRLYGTWLLAGRGHVLKLKYDNVEAKEVYEIKELNSDDLILNIDIGMEIKGIAKIHMKRPFSLDNI